MTWATKPGILLWISISGFESLGGSQIFPRFIRSLLEYPVSPGSYLVDDWRYRNEIDKVMTSVFLARYMFGAIQPDDDIEELKWFRLNRKFDFGGLVSSHKPLLSGVLDAIEQSSVKQLKEGTIHELPAEN